MHIHLIGIGGVSLSFMAKYLKAQGFFVTGSDIKESFITEELENMSMPIFYGHKPENCVGADIIIYNSAISNDNPELKYARINKIPCFERAEVLRLISKRYPSVIGVAGCHGKTSVTSMICHILSKANLKFTAHIGGFDTIFGNFYQNGNDLFLSEVCEFNKNIDKFDAKTAIVLNIDNDHLNSYEGLDEIAQTFYSYLNRADFRIVNSDDNFLKQYKKDCLTFGFKEGDYCLHNLINKNGKTMFEVYEYGAYLYDFHTDIIGKYQVENILAATAAARHLNICVSDIVKGLESFKGVKRRNEYINKFKGADVIADYAHHPTEIKSFLDYIIKKKYQNTHVVFQPHTYSRTKFLLDDFINLFKDFDKLYIYKTFAARENYDYEGSGENLSNKLPKSLYFDNFDELIKTLGEKVSAKDAVLVIGAGDLYDKFIRADYN